MRSRIRRLALIGGLIFIAASTAFHFLLGSAVANYFPSWRYAAPPDQAISIISISHNVREERQRPPTPSPTAPPRIVLRTSSHLAPLHYREMTSFEKAQLALIRPPARRTSTLYVVGPKRTKPGMEDAPGATNAIEPTPSPGVAASKVDTGGPNEENAASVWGDDNPPRVIQLAQLTSAQPPKTVRIAVEVGPDGNVISMRILQSSGDSDVDAAALEAARKTVFAPATANGIPVHGSIVLEFPAPATTGST
jgi:TonB family protein